MTGNTKVITSRTAAIKRARWRTHALRCLPEWYDWPRTLKYTMILLATHGKGEDGLKEIATEIDVSYESLKKLINKWPIFKEAMELYWETDILASYVPAYQQAYWHVSFHDIASLLAEDAPFIALVQSDRQMKKGKLTAAHVKALADMDFSNPEKPEKEPEADEPDYDDGIVELG